MAVQIPFPLPSHGYAQNSKMRVNLDFLVDKFNEFNTGTATWDNVSIGIANNETGTLTFFNSANANYLAFQAGATSPSFTYTWPVAVAASTGVLLSTTAGIMSWSNAPTLAAFNATSTMSSPIYNVSNGSVRWLNALGWATAFIPSQVPVVDLTFTLPATLGNAGDILSVNGLGVTSWVPTSGFGFTNTTLSNLTDTVAINKNLNNFSAGTITASLTGAASLNLLLTGGTLTGALIIDQATSQLVLGGTGGGQRITITAPAPAANLTYTIPDSGAAGTDFVLTKGTQSFAGNYTFSNPVLFPAGSATTPAVSISETNTGFLLGALHEVDLALNGGVSYYWTTAAYHSFNIIMSSGTSLTLTDNTTGTIAIKAPTAVTSYTLTLPVNDGNATDVLTTDGSGVTSWASLTGVGGANNTLSNLSDTVAINKNLQNFSAGTITASLTGAASLNVLKAGDTMTGALQLNSVNLVFHAALGGFKQVAIPNDAASWTMTLPSNHGTTGQVLVDSDGAGTLGWGAAPGNVTSGTAGRLALYATSAAVVGDTYAQNTKNINVAIASHPTLAANRVYTIPEAGADSTFLMTNGTYVAPGTFDFGQVWITTGFGFAGAQDLSITRTLPAATRAYNIPDVAADCDFVMAAGNQGIAGTKTFSGDMGIGTTSPNTYLGAGNGLAIVHSGATATRLNLVHAHTTPNSGLVFESARGTIASITESQSGDTFGAILGRGCATAGSFSADKVAIRLTASETWTSTANGTSIVFATTPVGSTTLASVLTISSAGQVLGLAGSATVPTFSFTSDSNSGMYNIGADNWACSVGGVKGVELKTTGVAVLGTTTNDSAAAGYTGEYVESVVGTTNFPASGVYGDFASISLTAGDWDITITGYITGSPWTYAQIGISTTSGNSSTGLVDGNSLLTIGNTAYAGLSIPSLRKSFSGTTTVYYKYLANYTPTAPTLAGRISARRVR